MFRIYYRVEIFRSAGLSKVLNPSFSKGVLLEPGEFAHQVASDAALVSHFFEGRESSLRGRPVGGVRGDLRRPHHHRDTVALRHRRNPTRLQLKIFYIRFNSNP